MSINGRNNKQQDDSTLYVYTGELDDMPSTMPPMDADTDAEDTSMHIQNFDSELDRAVYDVINRIGADEAVGDTESILACLAWDGEGLYQCMLGSENGNFILQMLTEEDVITLRNCEGVITTESADGTVSVQYYTDDETLALDWSRLVNTVSDDDAEDLYSQVQTEDFNAMGDSSIDEDAETEDTETEDDGTSEDDTEEELDFGDVRYRIPPGFADTEDFVDYDSEEEEDKSAPDEVGSTGLYVQDKEDNMDQGYWSLQNYHATFSEGSSRFYRRQHSPTLRPTVVHIDDMDEYEFDEELDGDK